MALITPPELARIYGISDDTLRRKLKNVYPLMKQGKRKRYFLDHEIEIVKSILGEFPKPNKTQ